MKSMNRLNLQRNFYSTLCGAGVLVSSLSLKLHDPWSTASLEGLVKGPAVHPLQKDRCVASRQARHETGKHKSCTLWVALTFNVNPWSWGNQIPQGQCNWNAVFQPFWLSVERQCVGFLFFPLASISKTLFAPTLRSTWNCRSWGMIFSLSCLINSENSRSTSSIIL